MFTYAGATYDREAIEQMTGSQLLDVYNALAKELGEPRVNRFASRADGQKRLTKIGMTWATRTKRTEAVAVSKPKKAPAAPAPKKAPAARTGRGPRPAGTGAAKCPTNPKFDFPLKEQVRPVREGTRRAAVYDLLKTGKYSFQELLDKLQYPAFAVYVQVRDLHFANGMGLSQDAKGRILIEE